MTELIRPTLTMPAPVAAHVALCYGVADVILEYGSGGSTVLAAELPDKVIFTVESDAAWLADVQGWFDANPTPSRPLLHHADIGPTKAWGAPKSESSFRLWPGYPNSVWDRPDFQAPDVVLIDGRFRLACLLTTMLRITRPTVALVDDYLKRPTYHTVETLVAPTRMVGRMAQFDLQPQMVPMDRLSWLIDAYLRPL